jgi:hypothetical protein
MRHRGKVHRPRYTFLQKAMLWWAWWLNIVMVVVFKGYGGQHGCSWSVFRWAGNGTGAAFILVERVEIWGAVPAFCCRLRFSCVARPEPRTAVIECTALTECIADHLQAPLSTKVIRAAWQDEVTASDEPVPSAPEHPLISTFILSASTGSIGEGTDHCLQPRL